jgi:RNA polymerase sigma-70 factor, ECF subfamily
MPMDDNTLVELQKRASVEHRVLRGAALKESMATLAYGDDIVRLVEEAILPDDERAAQAFAALMERFWAGLVSTCYRVFPNLDKASELAREVSLKIWIERKRLDPSRNFKAYLRTVAKNYCLDLLRRDLRQGSLSPSRLDSTDAPIEVGNPESPAFIEMVADPYTLLWEERVYLKEAVQRALQQLAPLYRVVLLLRFDEGYTRRELAEDLRCTEQNVGIYEREAIQLFQNYFLAEWNEK